MKINKVILNIIKILCGVLILGFLYYKIGFQNIYTTLLNLNPLFLVFLLFLYFLDFLIAALIYKVLLLPLGIRIRMRTLFRYHAASWAVGMFTPGKVGHFSMIYLLKKANIDIKKSIAVTFLHKAITLTVICLIAVTGLFFFFGYLKALKVAMLLTAVFLILTFLIFSKKFKALIKRYILGKFGGKIADFFVILRFYLKKQKKILLLNFGLSFLKYILGVLRLFVLLLFFQTHVPFHWVLLIVSISTISSLIPLTISGLGIKEGVGIFLFSRLGTDITIVASAYLILTSISYLIAGITTLLTLKKLK